METLIYADLVFLINFIMDILIFWIVSKLTKTNTNIKKIILGGFSASILFCFIIFYEPIRSIYNIVTTTCILIIGIYIAFKPKYLNEMLKLIVLSYISSFFIGGMCLGLFYFTNLSNVIGNMIAFNVENFSLKILIVSSSTTYIILKLTNKWLKKIFSKKPAYYSINIYYENLKTNLITLLDTGNNLFDPLDSSPVIIAEFGSIKSFLPDDIKLLFYENTHTNISNIIKSTDNIFRKRFRLIPYRSLGNPNGILLGFRSDKIEIFEKDKTICVNNVIIGISNFKLSNDNSYQGLLNPEIIYLS